MHLNLQKNAKTHHSLRRWYQPTLSFKSCGLLLLLSILFLARPFLYSPNPGSVSPPLTNRELGPEVQISHLEQMQSSASETPGFPSAIVVEVAGFEDQSGDCLVAIYDSPSSFNRVEQSIASESKEVRGASVEFHFAGIASKKIAIAVFHDRNRNGLLDKNVWGIPIERYGFSNNPSSPFGPPSFAAAEIRDLKPENGAIKIVLDRLKISDSK
jgi:uncharacterized protein (DUF2141 family)